ncbi:hypothetical protein OOZ35_00375 [Mesoflavibacter profundi]|uniref:Fibronectin type-III domain-containing protein n=1 Tax=Mesoflavibacter profundi TaxID=2708110 RepID=A0ABT4RVX3_9FLAO|nr:hypothetical protein [Mesoflavibacter profundi]MDA0175880.1 hypothetical protein [Mesoflavibacter profundi]MDA0175927.1 hypothetical protein [Mesoflavibacter profundi]MDA0175941.1 hypothetical protein [Mesoflavibacter profundi]
MIQAIQTPFPGNVLLDGNNTTIIVQSSNSGVDYYFRAKIYINNELFDTQSWSRKDNFVAEKNLRYLYNAYFNTHFNQVFTDGLIEQDHLKKEVKIIVEEYSIADDTLTQTLELPIFHILFNTKSVLFDDAQPVSILGLDTNYLQTHDTGVIVIPFFANTNNEVIRVTTTLDTGTVLDVQTVAATTDKKVYLYTYNLNNINYSNLFVKTEVAVGDTVKTFTYKLFKNPTYPVKEIAFKNNFGFYIPVYFVGEFSSDNNYKTNTYDNFDFSETIFDVEENATYKINTNYLHLQELPIVNQVSNALQSFFKDATGYTPINTTTKKAALNQDREHLFNTELTFTFKKGLPLDNNGFLVPPEVDNITVSGDENTTFDISKLEFENVYSDQFPISQIYLSPTSSNGVFTVVFLNGDTEVVNDNQYYNWDEIDKFTFTSGLNESGDNYQIIQFQLGNYYFFSNQANLIININDLPDINLPPQILPDGTFHYLIFKPAGTTGSTDVALVTVQDPEDDTFTVLWTLPDNPPGITISNETTLTPTLTADNSSITGQWYDLKITATDSNGNSSEKTHLLLVAEVASRITVTEEDPVGTTRIFNVNIDRGLPNGTIDLEFDYNVYSNQKYAAVFSNNLNDEKIINLQNRKQTFTKTFDANGEINFEVTIENAGISHDSLKITQLNPSNNMVIDKSFEVVYL